ncbi:hypothetical protein FGG08_006028 [Glutinoglossum americanum]|uniref:Uncharacterized protein n=1 Tax=Glutinoglossum americanum TaxID=1670608 RepID=A0A9P8KXX2_9PEZI|nr:hypothetical protein FGG08_006028 [Glutinoglossum americanum]
MDTSGEDSIATDTAELAISNDKPTAVVPGTQRIHSTEVKARDITPQFTNASSALRTGQLVKDEFFTLFEAVGALEVRI